MGLTRAALIAGTTQATDATSASAQVAANSNSGSRELSAAQLAITRFRATVNTIPATIPAPTLNTVELKTMRSTCPRFAPSARRIPNSFVRCTTVYETTLYNPTDAKASASAANPPNSHDTSCPRAYSGSRVIQCSRSFTSPLVCWSWSTEFTAALTECTSGSGDP